jgi:hypothetical protein
MPYHRSTSIPTPNFEMVTEDAGVVPHTPVLEGHQLSKVQTLPTPLEVRPVSVPHIPESSLTESIQAPGLQLVGEAQLMSGVATVPPTTESRDTSAAVSLVEREGGDVPDDIIHSMVAAVASSGDEEEEEEEGELVEEEKGEVEEGELAEDEEEDTSATPSSLPHTSTTSLPSTSTSHPSTSSLVTTSASASHAKSGEGVGQTKRVKRQPIVWDEPSSSGTATGGTSRPQSQPKRHIKIQRGTGRRSLRFKGKGPPFRK